MTEEEKRRSSSPLSAWIIVIVFGLTLIFGIRYGSGEEMHATTPTQTLTR